MTDQKKSDDILELINDLSAEAAHSDEESRAELRAAGIAPERFADAASERARLVLALERYRPEPKVSPFDARVRTWSFVAIAASVLVFAAGSLVNQRRGFDAELADLRRRAAEQAAARSAISTPQFQIRFPRNAPYADRIVAGIRKLEMSRDPGDRKVAIWVDLLPVLQEAQKNRDDFLDVAPAYQNVLPLLRVRDPEVFLDSYWGELWILNILLDSRIAPIVDAARKQAPEPAVIDRIFEQNSGKLVDQDRKAFAEAVSVYKAALSGTR